jgi:hypothetical protein
MDYPRQDVTIEMVGSEQVLSSRGRRARQEVWHRCRVRHEPGTDDSHEHEQREDQEPDPA